MRIDVIDTEAGFEALRGNWDEVYMADSHAQYFLSWTWLKPYLFRRTRWFILGLREKPEGSPHVAFLPLRVMTEYDEDSGIFIDEIIMAGNFSADYTGFLAVPKYERHAIQGFSSYLKQQNWTHLKLEYFYGSDERRDAFLLALQGPDVMFRDSATNKSPDVDNCVCPVVTLPSDFDDYLEQKMSSQTRQKLRRFLRKVDGDPSYRITMATAETITRDLDILFDFWRIKWLPKKGEERTARLITATRALLMDSFESGNLEVPVLWHEDRPLGVLANMLDHQKKAILFYITGRDENWKTPSPGLILHGYCIRRAIENGFRTYDFLRGTEAYKYMFGPEERRLSCTIFRTRSGQNLGGQLNRRSVDYLYRHGLQLYRDGEKAKAAAAFTQVFRAVPDHIGAEFGLASLTFDSGRLHEAEAAFSALIGRVGDPEPVYIKLGETQLALERYDDAARTFGRIIQIAPYHVQAHYKQGVALAAGGRKEEAARAFAMVERYNYDDPKQQGYANKARDALRRIVSEAKPAITAKPYKAKKVARAQRNGASAEFELEPALT